LKRRKKFGENDSKKVEGETRVDAGAVHEGDDAESNRELDAKKRSQHLSAE